jgi:hypothetical protein
MSPTELRTQLETVARRLGVRVGYEPFQPGVIGRGGLCKVRGETRILVDAAASVVEQVATLEDALAKLDLEGIFVPPLVRARLDAKRKGHPEMQADNARRRDAPKTPPETPNKTRGPALRKAR